MLLLGILKIPLNYWNTTSLFFLGTIFMAFKKHAPLVPSQNHLDRSHLLSRYALLGIIAVQLYFIFFLSLNIPIISWDAVATIAFNAKIVYDSGSLQYLPNFAHTGYPLFTAFIEAWISFVLGYWDYQVPKIIFPLSCLSLVICVYYYLKTIADRRWALLGVAGLLSSPLFTFHATDAYNDFFMLSYATTATILLLLWHQHRDKGYIGMAGLFAGFLTFIKVEGLIYLVVISLFFLFLLKNNHHSLKIKINQFLCFCVPAYLIWMVFAVYKTTHHIGLESKAALELSLNNLSRFPAIFQQIMVELCLTTHWHLFWIFFFLSLSQINRLRQNIHAQALLFLIFLYFSSLVALAAFTASFIWIAGPLSQTTLPRLILHIYPSAVLFVFVIFKPASKINTSGWG
jgi:4-amino-4-deoxy-L-arabinose transferase-like glycosyltransferase